MADTTGADANDEFARWLAETARAEQAAAQAQQAAAAPPPAATPVSAPAAPPAQPPVQQPPSPEFLGADQLAAAPPTRPYEAGPQVARSSYQAAVDPAAPAQPPAAPATPYVTPTVLPAQAPPAAAPSPTQDPGLPSWAPGYVGPGTPTAPPAAAPDSFFPSAPGAAPVAQPPAAAPLAAPPVQAPPVQAPPVQAPPIYQAPAQPQAPVYEPVQQPAAQPVFPPAASPVAAPPAAPAFPPVAEQAPPTLPPLVPDAGLAPAAPSASDPFGSLFAADDPNDIAQRLASSPPPLTSPPPASPTGEIVADADPMKSLFGLETSENPALAAPAAPTYVPEPAAPVYAPEPVAAPEPVYVPEPAAPAYTPYTPEPAYTPAAPAAAYAAEPPSDNDPTAGTQFFGGGTGDWEEPPDLDRTTTPERIAFILAFLLPPIGLIASIVLAAQSARRRGWVHGFVRTGLVIALIMTLVAGVAGAYFYKVLDDQRNHDALEAASAQFCSTIHDNPDMVSQPAFGFPAPGATIPDTMTSIQAYIDKWDALAKVSPSGIRADVTKVADAAREILDNVTTTHLVNNDENVAVMSSVASGTNIVGWSQEYCG